MAKSSPWLFGLIVITLSGCASYQPKPLVPHDVLRDLQRVRLETLAASPTPTVDTGPPRFDPTDGLSSEEAVAVALFANPALRAFRRERGVAEGEVVAAGVLSNPFLEVTWLHIENLTKSLATSGFDIGLRWSPPRPGEIAAKRARAEARLAEVRAQIADEEWKLAADARKAHASVLATRERRRFADAALALQGRVRQFLRDKRDLGDASRLEANLIELEYFETVREREAILTEETRARQELNRVLGLPPLTHVALQGEDLAYRALRLHPGVLEAVMIDRRPDLRVAREAYEQAQQQLRLAHILRIPWLSFGPAWERDGSAEEGVINKVGVGIGFEIPLANLNRGELMRLDAARERLREGFAASVHTARAEVAEALRALRAHERLVRIFEDEIRPVLDENAQLTGAALELGDVNVLQFVTAQTRVLKGRREFIEARLDYWKAVFDLERALGARVTEVEGREE
jgi:cobalt-zinc-cadmium efflux system outer membrane protein